ncbi:MAG: hypothetical protein ACE5KI_03320 [Dehalococcoidia bacterium]
MGEEQSLEGWAPELDENLGLDRIIDLAHDYRGNTTIVKTDGTKVDGYIFNRNGDVSEPYIEYFDLAGAGPFTLLYSEIENILFTGKDTAAGKSYEAWLERKKKEKIRKQAEGSGAAS